jgi:hypothetical protein
MLTTTISNINNNSYKCNLNSKIYLNGNNFTTRQQGINGNNSSSSNSTISNNSTSSSSDNNKKTINQLLDIDGLTTNDDNCNKRLIEREDYYKKEIAFYKNQVQRCQLFLNNLSNNPGFYFGAHCDFNSDLYVNFDLYVFFVL